MINKSRKLIALLLMVALVVTYTFGANLSVFAEEPQGDANAKTSASESADPAPATEDTAKEEPAPAPAPSEGVGETGGGEPAAGNDKEVKEEEANVEGEELEEAVTKKVWDPIETRPINYDTTYTCKPHNDFVVRPGEVEHWELSGADGCYEWNEETHVVTNKNKTDDIQSLTITHFTNIPGNSGYVNKESWIVKLNKANKVFINYYTVDAQLVHSDVSIQPDYKNYTFWGAPEREGYVFLGWLRHRPGSYDTRPDYTPGQTIDLSHLDPPLSWHDKKATLNLYALWAKDTADLGSVTGLSDSFPYTGEDQVLYGIKEGSDNDGYSKFKAVRHGGGGNVWYTNYYVKTNDVYAKGKEVGEYNTAVNYAKVYVENTNITGGIRATNMYVQVKPGTLTIADVFDGEVTANSKTLPYNGAEQAVYGITKAPNVEDDFVVFKTVSIGHAGTAYAVQAKDIYAKGTDAGEYTTSTKYAEVFSRSILAGSSYSSTGKYVKVNPGKLTITALPVTIDVTVTLDREPVITKPYTGEQYIVTFNTVKLDTENEVLLSEWEDPSWTGQRHDLWVQGTDAGEYYTKVKDTLNSYDLGENVNPDNYDITFNVTQGTLEIYSEPATLTFKLNGGNVGGNTDDIVVEANTGDVVTIIDAPAREGYEFQYWEGSKYYPGDEYKVMGDHTFTAVWAKTNPGGGDDDSDSDKNDKNDKKGKDGNGSSTGDEVGLIGIMALLAASIFGLYALTALRRREE